MAVALDIGYHGPPELTLAIAALPARGEKIRSACTGRAARLITFPAITGLVMVLTPFLLYFTPWYQAGFTSVPVREITFVALIVPGLVFFWTLLRVDPVPRQYPYLVALWVSGVEVIGDAVLGLAVIADQHLIASAHYHAVARPWGPSLATDQIFGGGVLWVVGDLIGLPFLVALLIAMIREDEGEAARVDAALDAAEALTAAGADGADGAGRDGDGRHGDGRSRPWWETDPRFAGRFGPPAEPGTGQ